MAQANRPAYTTYKFHNLSNEALAGAIGHADAVLKGAEAQSQSAQRRIQKPRITHCRRRALHRHSVRPVQ